MGLSGRLGSSGRYSAADDRRRRMLILRSQREQSLEPEAGSRPSVATARRMSPVMPREALPVVTFQEASETDVSEMVSFETSVAETVVSERPARESEVVFAPAKGPRPLTHAAERIRDLLDDPTPRTWLFTGDSLGFDVRHAARSWGEHFGDVIRSRLNRKLDVVLDSTMTDGMLTGLRQDAEWRVLRFQPDVVVIMPGLADVALGPPHREDFRTSLEELVLFLQDEGCMVILSTPPSVMTGPGYPPDGRDLPAYAGLIRDVARKCDVVLADHFARWQVTLRQNGSLGELLDKSGVRPSRTGHRKLAGHLLRTLGVQLQ